MASRTSTKLFIPHPIEANCTIVGILEQLAPEQTTKGRKIALILHGTMGHKDYLFQKRLALKLPLDSFRFDFRGNHETGGPWKFSSLDEDVDDVSAVVNYLQTEYGYVIDMLAGHSRGSVVGLRWMCTHQDGKNVSAFVNISARYRMHKIADGPTGRAWKDAFETQGYYEWKVVVARKLVTGIIRPEAVQPFANFDTSLVWDKFPSRTHVLTLHGLGDDTVPPYDGLIYARALGNRTPGTHNIHFIEDADHNFTGRQDEVVDTILEWWGKSCRDEFRTGVWMTGIQGKL